MEVSGSAFIPPRPSGRQESGRATSSVSRSQAIRPVMPGPQPPFSSDDISSKLKDGDTLPPQEPQIVCILLIFSQSELNDLLRDLSLSKDAAKLIGSRIKIKIY
ncbi:hypothetical protein TNCV_2662231 [Trichonephila clavipes]|nr:hypothetical protein TNCV_2662231 [Trichonephila clavipes]